MESNQNNKLGNLLGKSKLISLFAVIVLYVSSFILVIIGIIKLYYIIHDLYYQLVNLQRIDAIFLTANFIVIIEIYLLSIIFYIFAVGIYKLFVGEFTLLSWYSVDSLDEMKAELAKTIVIFLSVFIIQKIVEWKDHQLLLYSGIVITLTSAILIWYIYALRNNNNHNRNNNT